MSLTTSPLLGQITGGSLAEGLQMRLAEGRTVEELRTGRFVVAHGRAYRYFCMITDVSLRCANPQALAQPPGPDDELLRQVLEGTATYAEAQLRPMLMLPAAGADTPGAPLEPVKTVPPHFSVVAEAGREDVARVFGSEEQAGWYEIGHPLDMEETPVCLHLDRLAERSTGIFGKSGTGKTFLTRLVLAGMMRQRSALNLVFDMHSEYGWSGRQEGARSTTRGLKQYFQDEVRVFTLDMASAERRGVPIEQEIRIAFSDLEIEDILLQRDELNLSDAAEETCSLLEQHFGRDWISSLLNMSRGDLEEFAQASGAHIGAISALKRKLQRMAHQCRHFLVEQVEPQHDALTGILGALSAGKHVVVEFGPHNTPLQYMLVANVLTRRIHHAYVRRTEEALGDPSKEPKPLVITIEEAHKFLAPGLSRQTIFGTIARELRKYRVTLLVVDQRPSGIDDEVLSQLGTKLVCLLDDDKDIEAVLSGVSNRNGLRGVLAGLETRQQALILGHAVPMPVVVRTRTYDDEAFRRAMQWEESSERAARAEENLDDHF
jgi:DNA helicase HerA-like ATPase